MLHFHALKDMQSQSKLNVLRCAQNVSNDSFHFLKGFQNIKTYFFLYFSVAVVGNVDAGKSTLLGVLTHGELDNGRGHARQRLFRHKHEMESGRTSSVGNDILGASIV